MKPIPMRRGLLYLGVFFLLVGCQTPSADPDPTLEFKFTMGRMVGVADVPIKDFHRASEAALQHLEVEIRIAEQDGLAGQILAYDADRDMIMIDLEALPGEKTRFSVRVGWSDPNKTRIIFQEIRERL